MLARWETEEHLPRPPYGSGPRLLVAVRLGRTVYSALRLRWLEDWVRSRAGAQGQWPIGRHPIRPVLKHGPRSLTCVRVTGFYET